MKKLGIVIHKNYCDCFNLLLFHFAAVFLIILGVCKGNKQHLNIFVTENFDSDERNA